MANVLSAIGIAGAILLTVVVSIVLISVATVNRGEAALDEATRRNRR